MDSIALIEEWTETRTGGIDPIHGVQDQAKYQRIMADLRENGWRGAPLVVDDTQALTGSHRFWAVHNLLHDEGIEIEIPRIDIADLCALFDVDWLAHRERFDDWIDAYIDIAEELPADVVAYLGMDMH
ncbi:hypothetical protein [Nocardia wallacei]|uniref:hypothetical protein n=1 Tax=Nocardia wallacei TaxID=480035 RepID=UPI0024550B6B|nr:hypothetical protein [Nocardia wallacei]